MLLGLDLGTGSLKALLIEPDGRVIASASSPYGVLAPHPGWAETDPQAWWDACKAAVQQLGHLAQEVTAIGLSGQMHGVVLCDAEARPMRPAVLWADARSTQELLVFAQLEPRLRQRLANPAATGMAGPSLLWLQRHQPELLEAARHALQPKDWLRLKLTGQASAEASDASATLLYDLEGDTWAFDLIEQLGLPAGLFGPILESAVVAGVLESRVAQELGLPAGIPVAAGGADTACAMLGAGLPLGAMQLSVGSGAQIVALRSSPSTDPALRTHLYRACAPKCWYAMAAMQNAGVALEWVLRVLGLDWTGAYLEAFGVAAGAEGLTFLPYLTGERTPHLDPNARGHWAGLGLHHSRAHLMRAALEGVAFSLRDGLDALGPSGLGAGLRMVGGGTQDPRWRQLLSDVLGQPLLASDVSDASARGAAVLSGIASGVFKDSEATVVLAPQPVVVAEPQPDPALLEARFRFQRLYQRTRQIESEPT